MKKEDQIAPGAPGVEPNWTCGSKDGVGSALDARSRVWFTHRRGILNEIFFPRTDQACTRDFRFFVTDGEGFFSDEERGTETKVERLAPGVPAYRLTNSCVQDRYAIEKIVIAHPHQDAVLQQVRFEPRAEKLRLFASISPRLGNEGRGNRASIHDYKSIPVLAAQREGLALAVVSSVGWAARSVGYAGRTDGRTQLRRRGRLETTYEVADNGNVDLTGEIPLAGKGATSFVLSLGFGDGWVSPGGALSEACLHAVSGEQDDFKRLLRQYVRNWEEWLDQERSGLEKPSATGSAGLVRASLSTIRIHEEKRFEGGIIASLSIPFGHARGNQDLGGYHYVWPRDLVQIGGGLLAAGAKDDALRVLHYLQAVQEADGSWAQNLWLDGQPFGEHLQLDQTALPILLVEAAVREGAVDAVQLGRLRPMVWKAAAFLAVRGPFTRQDRWEEMPGYATFTLAVQIAALVAASSLLADAPQGDLPNEASDQGESQAGRTEVPGMTDLLLDLADDWFDHLDYWTFTTDSELARRFGAEGHYVRLAPQESDEDAGAQGRIDVMNRPQTESRAAANVVSPDFLALVRYGLRRGDDPRIVDTLKVVDGTLRDELPQGPCWRRFTDDGYGEHADGSPYDGAGIGRPWPLLTGERGHYELAAGRVDQAQSLLDVLATFAGTAGALPEQVWNADDLPELDLYRGGPTHSAKPLVWAHAEYLKLVRSLRDGRVFDFPTRTGDRYLRGGVSPSYVHWSTFHQRSTLVAGRRLRVLTNDSCLVRWALNDGETREAAASLSTLGLHVAELPTERAEPGDVLRMTVHSAGDSPDHKEQFALRIR